jgi:hypothetical protein
MHRAELEHVIRASGSIVGHNTLIVLGSQAILGSVPDPPEELVVSMEADVYAPDAPELSDLISGSIGEMSPFHTTFGYYGDGVGPETAVLPAGWEARLVPIANANTNGVTGLCLSPVDIAVSKLAAGRPKDMRYVRALLRHAILRADDVQAVTGGLAEPHASRVRERLEVARSNAF